jgi:EAL domain-containing protein (putative c-di-GMP-specific phosphodiesterase class I)
MFQAALEDKSTAAALGEFMLEQVFQDAVKLRNFGIRPGHIAINLTNADFRSDQFLDRFSELSRETGIPRMVCVEVTEGMFLERSHELLHKGLHCLHDAGVMIALDDFGTGYASLTHLQKLPLDRIKIDKSFVANIVSAPDDLAIVQGIIEIGHKLGKPSSPRAWRRARKPELLASMKCDFLQGWYFGKAEDPALVEDAFQNIPMMVRELSTPG